MRFPSRSLAVVLLAAGAASCTDTRSIDSPIPPGMRAGRIELNPVFSQAAQTIAASISDFGITFDHVRVAIRNTPDTTRLVRDTTVAFGSTSTALTLDITVPVDADGQLFNALVQYIGPSGVVYSGTIIVQSHAPDQPAPEQQNLVLSFVGPGAKLKTIAVAPKPVNLVGSQSVPITITAKDSTGAAITVPPLVFTSSDASIAKITGTTNPVVQSFGKRGTALLVATTPIGISDTLSANVTLPAASIVLVSGGGQTGTVGTALASPAVVQVNALDGIGVAGVAVTFAPPIGGSVGTTTATTDANGRASTTLTLATGSGAQSFLATAAGFNQPIPATAVAGPAAAATSTIASNVAQLNADNTSSATITVQARDQYGNLATTGGATVTLTTSLGHFGATGAATTVTATDAGNGTYTAALFSSQSGTITVTGTVGGTAIATPAVTINAIAALIDHFDITRADGSSLAPSVPAGTPIAVKVTARDKSNNVVTSFTGQPKMRVVNSFFTPDSVVVAPAAVAGVTVVNLTFSQPNTNVDITATATVAQGTLTTASVAFSVVTGPAARINATGFGEVVINDFDTSPSRYPSIQVTDGAGNTVAGQVVNFTIVALPSNSGSPQCTFSGGGSTVSVATNSDGTIAFDGESLNIAESSRPNSCLLLAQATANGLPLPPLFVSLLVRQAGGSTWTGKAHDTRWTSPGNWDGAVPTSNSNVFLPWATTLNSSTLQAPKLTASQAVGTIDIEDAAQLDLGGNTLTVGGTINGRIAGTISNGTVATAVANNGGNISGILPNVNCSSGEYSLSSAVIVTGNFANSGCQVFFNGQTMTVAGNFSQTGSGVIGLTTPNDLLDVSGDALFSGGDESDLLTNGFITARGSLTQSGGAGALATSFLQHTQMVSAGTTARTLSLGSPASSKFTYLALNVTPSSAITVQSTFEVDSALSIVASSGGTLSLPSGMVNTTNGIITITASGLTANIGGIINSHGLIFNTGTTVTLNGSGNLSLGNGFLQFNTNAHVTINVTGTVIAGAGCTRQAGVIIDGANTTAVAALNAGCRVVP